RTTGNTPEAHGSRKATHLKSGQPLPYGDAFSVVTHLHLKMEPAVFTEGARVRLRILREQHPEAYSALLQELTQQEQPA
ncbi:plasmid partitioning protein B, partial [Streptomyces sp. NPDC020766]